MKPAHTRPNVAQRGAMFGLDARITMAIFILLSLVIYEVYIRVITQIELTKFSNFVSAYTKAVEAHIIDSGGYCPAYTQDLQRRDASVPPQQWKGPYLGIGEDGSRWAFSAMIRRNANTGLACANPAERDCTNALYFVGEMKVARRALAPAFLAYERQIDGTKNPTAGRITHGTTFDDLGYGGPHTNFGTQIILPVNCHNGFIGDCGSGGPSGC